MGPAMAQMDCARKVSTAKKNEAVLMSRDNPNPKHECPIPPGSTIMLKILWHKRRASILVRVRIRICLSAGRDDFVLIAKDRHTVPTTD